MLSKMLKNPRVSRKELMDPRPIPRVLSHSDESVVLDDIRLRQSAYYLHRIVPVSQLQVLMKLPTNFKLCVGRSTKNCERHSL